MKKNLSNRVVKLIVSLPAIAVTSVAMIGTVVAWGPTGRPTYTLEKPADHPVFNSITDNPAFPDGNEQYFVYAREEGDDTWHNEVDVVPGKNYEVYIYYHNNAASNLNDDGNGVGVAKNVRVSSTYPALLKKGVKGVIEAHIKADNTTPKEVWDEAYLTSDEDVVLRYSVGTATIHNQNATNGSILSTNLFTTTGAFIGTNEMDGVVYGCAEYSGYITYTLTAEKADFEFNKEVSTDGETWAESIERAPGQYATYHVSFKNTGNTDFTNVVVSDSHDEGLTIRPGSVKIFDVNHVDGETIDDGILENTGYNFGTVAAGALIQLNYQAKVADDGMCGKTLNNTIRVSYNQGESVYTDSATVKVVCEETPEELPSTGPAEIIMAVLIVLGITGGGFYLWRTRRTLKAVENNVSGNAMDKDSDKDSSQKPDNMVQ